MSKTPKEITLYASCRLPTDFGEFQLEVYRDANGEESILLSQGVLEGPAPLVRVHSECFTGEVLHSQKCDCRAQLQLAMEKIAAEGRGALIYLHQEGRGIGLGDKIRAYAMQDEGADTLLANQLLGLPIDAREYSAAAAILRVKGLTRIRLHSNNPEKKKSLEAHGITIEEVVPSATPAGPHNERYLKTKLEQLGHIGLAESLDLQAPSKVDEPHKSSASSTLVIFDLDGVIQIGEQVPEAARVLIHRLAERGCKLRYLTNDGYNSRASRSAELRKGGIPCSEDQVYTAAYLAARYIRSSGRTPVFPLLDHPAIEEFADLDLEESASARSVVIGDYFRNYDFETLKKAYAAIENGAELVAMHKKRAWPTPKGWVIDIGFWVAGLEHCAGREATLVGKPSEFSYASILADAGVRPSDVVMVSDEVDPDLIGAQKLGIRSVLLENPHVDKEQAPFDGLRIRSLEELEALL